MDQKQRSVEVLMDGCLYEPKPDSDLYIQLAEVIQVLSSRSSSVEQAYSMNSPGATSVQRMLSDVAYELGAASILVKVGEKL